MSHEGSCHCGAIIVTITDDPVEVSECNCSICRRIGALCAYAPPACVAGTRWNSGWLFRRRSAGQRSSQADIRPLQPRLLLRSLSVV